MIEESECQRMILMQKQSRMREEREQRQQRNAEKTLEVIHISYHKKSEMQIHLLMQYLSILKTQLPSMPHHHLTTVLFSPSHENLLLIGHHHQLLAGLTFYRIQGKRAFELSLMAASESSKGYGALLVNHLKTLAQIRKIAIIATHADDSAIGFYQKMGFSTIEYTENKVLGEKEFSYSTIMQTRVSPKVDYGQLRNVLKRQKEHLLRSFSKKREMAEIDCSQDVVMRTERLRIDPSRLVGVTNFWEEHRQIAASLQHRRYKQMVSKIERLIEMADPALVEMPAELLQLTFLAYQKPIQLTSLKENAASGKYETESDFKADLSKFLSNCWKFYASNPHISQNLALLQEEIQKMIVSG